MTQAKWMAAAALAAVLFGVSLAAGGTPPRPANSYVGSKTCFTCHIDYARQWAKLTHSQMLSKPGRKPADAGCEACHGPGRRHAAKREWRSEIVRWKSMAPPEQTRRCLRCHAPKVTAAGWKASPHAKMQLPCLMCHEVHVPTGHPRNLKQAQKDVCTGCHGQIPEMVKDGKHHALPASLRCSQCHEIHSAARPKLLRADKKVLCRQCHAPNGKRVRPSSHTEEWAKAHGKSAKADSTRCDVCHSRETYCNACHGTAMPHPEDWAMKHGKDALSRPRTCAKCHDEKKCNVCHAQMKPKSHEAEDFKKKHGVIGVQSGPLCSLCHAKNPCNTCHGTPMPHPEGWIMGHKEKGASHAADGLCLKRCHEHEADCKKCHPDDAVIPAAPASDQ